MLVKFDIICAKCQGSLVGQQIGWAIEVATCPICVNEAKEKTTSLILNRIKKHIKKGGDKA